MRPTLSTTLALSAALLLSLPGLGLCARHARTAEATPEPTPEMTGSPWGVGAAYLPGPGGALDAISITYRGKPDWDFDGMLLGGSASGTVTTSFGGGSNTGSDFGIGAQARYGLLHPSQYLVFQLVGRLSYVTGSTSASVSAGGASENGTFTTSVLGVFVGAGFEAFFAYWRNVSIELNTGVNFASENTTASGGGNSVSSGGSAFGIGASNVNSFVPLDLAVHYYF
jgi:hypothetical protein